MLCCGGKIKKLEPYTIAILGAESVGKSTLTAALAQDTRPVHPTNGFATASISVHERDIAIFDLGGAERIRDIWINYYSEVHGLIFVVDSTKRSSFPETALLLCKVMTHFRMAGKPVLILANKQDIAGAAPVQEVHQALGLSSISSSTAVFETVACKLLACSAIQQPVTSVELSEGISWLEATITQHYRTLSLRRQEDMSLQRQIETAERTAKKERVALQREARRLEEAKAEQDSEVSAQGSIQRNNWVDETSPNPVVNNPSKKLGELSPAKDLSKAKKGFFGGLVQKNNKVGPMSNTDTGNNGVSPSQSPRAIGLSPAAQDTPLSGGLPGSFRSPPLRSPPSIPAQGTFNSPSSLSQSFSSVEMAVQSPSLAILLRNDVAKGSHSDLDKLTDLVSTVQSLFAAQTPSPLPHNSFLWQAARASAIEGSEELEKQCEAIATGGKFSIDSVAARVHAGWVSTINMIWDDLAYGPVPIILPQPDDGQCWHESSFAAPKGYHAYQQRLILAALSFEHLPPLDAEYCRLIAELLLSQLHLRRPELLSVKVKRTDVQVLEKLAGIQVQLKALSLA